VALGPEIVSTKPNFNFKIISKIKMKYALLKIILRKEVHMIKFSINMFCKQLVFIDFLFSAQSDDLMPLFEKYGDVGDIYLPLERGTGRSRGFAFVRYSTRFIG